MSWGPNLLIKQGAKLVQEWNDVVVELKAEDRRELVEQCRNRLIPREMAGDESNAGIPASDLSSQAGAILRALKNDEPVGLDALVDQFGDVSMSEIMATLFELELGGLVRQLPGKSYIKVWGE
jgi:DNA processing protein